ncbi:MAG: competence/damage-inducible protein A [Ignavibacteriales bacterium]
MKAYLISIGDELLIGQTINTNAAFIGEKLTDLNIRVIKSSVIGDEESAILSELALAESSSDLIIITGGLGPTHDDITLKTIAKYFDTELVINQEVLNDIKDFFKRRGRELNKINEDQALVPKIANVIRNQRGTAPGSWIEKNNKIFISMPGVPQEMIGMMENFILPKLFEIMETKSVVIIKKNLLTTGIPESNLFLTLGDLDEILEGDKLAFLPNQFGVKMRVTVTSNSQKEAEEKLSLIEQRIRLKVGRFIYGKENESLEEVIGRILSERGLTIAVAESCTGGLISSRLTNISGSSKYFQRGFVTYSNASKVENLKVNEDVIQKYGAVSIEVARQMAEGVKAVSGTDIGLAVTGILGPTGGSAQKPVGLVYIGLCDEKICTAREYHFGEDRLLNKDRVSQAALELLRRHLLGISSDD